MFKEDDVVNVIPGGIAVDDRGMLSFCNGFNFKDVKRFYMVENFAPGFVRAWHGHKEEGKYVTVVSGSAIIGLVDLRRFNDWNYYNKLAFDQEDIIISGGDLTGEQDDELQDWYGALQHRHIVTARKPSVIYIPPGFANGAMNIEENTKIMYFSTKAMGEAPLDDDYRFPVEYWDENIWKVEQR
jgi:dTDP-4-dehydrorhamnose 3,5-epimerase